MAMNMNKPNTIHMGIVQIIRYHEKVSRSLYTLQNVISHKALHHVWNLMRTLSNCVYPRTLWIRKVSLWKHVRCNLKSNYRILPIVDNVISKHKWNSWSQNIIVTHRRLGAAYWLYTGCSRIIPFHLVEQDWRPCNGFPGVIKCKKVSNMVSAWFFQHPKRLKKVVSFNYTSY